MKIRFNAAGEIFLPDFSNLSLFPVGEVISGDYGSIGKWIVHW
jgi:hypothetical protein